MNNYVIEEHVMNNIPGKDYNTQTNIFDLFAVLVVDAIRRLRIFVVCKREKLFFALAQKLCSFCRNASSQNI